MIIFLETNENEKTSYTYRKNYNYGDGFIAKCVAGKMQLEEHL